VGVVLRVALGVMLLALTVWAVAALWIDVRVPWLRGPLAMGYGVGVVVIGCAARGWWRKAGLTAGAGLLVLVWWLTLQPSNDRDWQPELAVLAYADIDGNRVAVHNVRNCVYRSETDFDVRHYDKTYELDQLRTVDLYLVYWGSPHIAHTMVSFGFEGGDYLCFSIETRKERGEGYSAMRGLFRQFELIYVAADERDLVRLRTSFRKGEDAYVYRLNGSMVQVREFFLDYLRRLNGLRQRPAWYNAMTQNCTTSFRAHRAAADRAPWDWRILVNGHSDALLYERGVISTQVSFAELRQRAHVNARAQAADQAADFSRRIRRGVPGMEP
jgi:hypothetical protein